MDLNLLRDKNGCIDLDKIEGLETKPECRGSTSKRWIIIPEEETRYLFKRNSIYSEENIPYELCSEIVASEIANSLGIPSAQYDLAIYKGKIGVITPDFLRENETLISGNTIMEYVAQKFRNLKNYYFGTNVKDMIGALNLYAQDLKIKKDIAKNIINSFIINFYLFGVVLAIEDGHFNNWGIIYDGENYSMAPIYDSCMIALSYKSNNEIREYINSCIDPVIAKEVLENNYDLDEFINLPIDYSIVNSIILWDRSYFRLHYGYEDSVEDMEDFDLFCKDYPDLAQSGFLAVSRFNISEILKKVEDRLGVNLPEDYKLWLSIATTCRKRTMESIIQKEMKRNGKDSEAELEGFDFGGTVHR